MAEQSEAQRLAAALDKAPYSSPCTNDAAAELRRLQSVNAQLLEALGFIANRQDLMFAECSDAEEIIEVARAAIAAAKGGA
jgi:hypothetical protein